MTIATLRIEVAIFIVALVISVIYASCFEWLLHRYLMHRPFLNFRYAFNAHARVHHRTFKSDDTYHVKKKEDEHLIHMAWWNGPVLVTIGLIPFAILCIFIGHWISILCGIGLGCAGYYGAYESLHWCMHKPVLKQRLIEHSWLFRRINGHHLLHHRYMHKNYNVVLPLWDLIFGTLMTRSPVAFAQARGTSVPDVQPLS
jgi:hypothetical protein